MAHSRVSSSLRFNYSSLSLSLYAKWIFPLTVNPGNSSSISLISRTCRLQLFRLHRLYLGKKRHPGIKDSFSNLVGGVLKVITIERGKIFCLLTIKPPTLESKEMESVCNNRMVDGNILPNLGNTTELLDTGNVRFAPEEEFDDCDLDDDIDPALNEEIDRRPAPEMIPNPHQLQRGLWPGQFWSLHALLF